MKNDANFCAPPLPLNMRQLLLAFGCPSPPITVDVISEHSQQSTHMLKTFLTLF